MEERPLADEIAVQRSIFHALERKAQREEPGSIQFDEVVRCLDFVERVNDLDWFADELPNNVQIGKIVADTLCRTDIFFQMEVKEELAHEKFVDTFGRREARRIKKNVIDWMLSPEHEPPQHVREKEEPTKLRYLDKSEKEIKFTFCWQETKLHEFSTIMKDLAGATPFTEASLILYLDQDIRPIMPRWRMDDQNESQSNQLTVSFNTRTIKTNDFQMLMAKLEEETGKVPAYIDWKDHVLFHVVWFEFEGPPEVQKLKTWEQILERVQALGVQKWSSHGSVRKRWDRLKGKISADQYGERWIKEKL